MMMKPKRKGIVAILGLGPKKDEEEDMSGEDLSPHKEAAAEELISAVKGGDAAKVAKAFKVMYDLCAAASEDDETEEEESSEDEEGDHEYGE